MKKVKLSKEKIKSNKAERLKRTEKAGIDQPDPPLTDPSQTGLVIQPPARAPDRPTPDEQEANDIEELKDLFKLTEEEIKEATAYPEGEDIGVARCDWARNHDLIVPCFIQLLNKNGLVPSARQIAERLRAAGAKISDSAVSKHLQAFDLSRWKRRLAIPCAVAAGRLARKTARPNPDAYDIRVLYEISGELKNVNDSNSRMDFRTMKERVNDGNADAAERARRLANILQTDA